MKTPSTTPVSKTKTAVLRVSLLSLAVLMVASAQIGIISPRASARDFDSEIRAVQEQIDQYNAEASRLSGEADTLQNEVARLDNEKAATQAQIDIKQAEYDQLVAQIAENEKKIADNQKVLGKIIADMYVDDDITPLEMIASSRNVGEYIDKQTLQSTVQDKLSQTIGTVRRTKAENEQKREAVKQNLADQTAARNVLAEKQAEQQRILDETRGQEAAYQTLSAQGRAERADLERQQQAAIAAALRASGVRGSAVAGDPSKGGYPANLANAAMDSIVDPWGMYNRECVSYTAWKVYQKNGYMPYWGGVGNANQWPGNARRAGIATGSTPRAGSVGVISSGAYGHVVWVESVNGDGTINISQYNELLPSGWGQYSERYGVNPGAYDTYIYF